MTPETKQTLDDLVFENRNKEYGSYRLRKKYIVRLAIGFVASLGFVLIIVMSYFWYLNAAGDENLYLYPYAVPYMKSTEGSLLSKEELDAYMGNKSQPEKQDNKLESDLSSNPANFEVTANASPDSFIPPLETTATETNADNMGLLVNDSTAFGGFPGDGTGIGGIFDRIPEFPGGNATKFVERNLRYPAIAIKEKIHGVVIVSFVVNKTGHVTDVKILQGVHPIIDEEAVKTIKSMPPWKPGMMHGKPINFLFRMPINFVPLS